ncbi:MAG: ABC transporter ATP-binding protein [Bryobacterales bacterium]|nr:ABC transporter ATP-binding protein [Bryobacterales bacterium]
MRFECSQLGLEFGKGAGRVQALDGLSFDVKEGEFLAVVGPSGCGKTTLLRTLAGLLPPTTGEVRRIPAPGEESPRTLIVFQEHGLFPWMTVLDNAAFGLEMQGVAKDERYARARQLLQRFGLAGREEAYPGQLSAGMKQRVAVVRSFISRPTALLMDEPFGALDYQTRLRLQQELLDLWEQERHTVVFVTHDIEEAILLSDRVLVLSAQPARAVGLHRVDFPRPRHAALTADPEFARLRVRILDELHVTPHPAPHALR